MCVSGLYNDLRRPAEQVSDLSFPDWSGTNGRRGRGRHLSDCITLLCAKVIRTALRDFRT